MNIEKLLKKIEEYKKTEEEKSYQKDAETIVKPIKEHILKNKKNDFILYFHDLTTRETIIDCTLKAKRKEEK